MTSKEALQNIKDYHNETVYDIDNIYTENMFEKQLDIIEKDLDRLEEHRNIEEEIGIDLTILFNALKNGVYYFDEQGQLIYSCVWLTDNHVTAGVHDKLSYSFKTPYHETLLFEDYGKTWALSEEELSKEKLEKVGQMTYLQEVLIEGMNEFCAEKFDLSYERTREEAEEYITKNIDEYKSLTTHNWY